jgi:pSer/pThr/pTyr-binding forkhead associated (FHA) protein
LALRFSIRATSARRRAGSSAALFAHDLTVDLDEGGLVIGRQAGVAIELPFAAISVRHARLTQEPGGLRIEDLGSANGTFLGERRLDPNVPEPVAIGEVIGVGPVDLVIEGEVQYAPAVEQGEAAAGTATLARRIVHDIFDAVCPAEQVRLVVESGPDSGREHILPRCDRVHRAGRGEGCDFILKDTDISREHVSFQRDADGVVVRDLGSKNGVEVQGRRLVGERRLHDGEVVRIGQNRLRLDDPEERYLRRLRETNLDAKVEPDAHSAPATVAGRPDGLHESAAARGGDFANNSEEKPGVQARRSALPRIATALAVLAMLTVAALVLTLAFAA